MEIKTDNPESFMLAIYLSDITWVLLKSLIQLIAKQSSYFNLSNK